MSYVSIAAAVAGVGMGLKSASDAKSAAAKEAQLQELSGQKRDQAAQLEGAVLDQNATASVAIAQRNMLDAQRVGKLTESRTVALAAASGGGATRGVSTVVGNIARQASYNAATALYQGEENARVERIQAEEKRQLGQFGIVGAGLESEATKLRGSGQMDTAYAGAIRTAGDLYAKYGGRGTTTSGIPDNGPNAGSGVEIQV